LSTSVDDYAAWVREPQLPARPAQPTSSYFICSTPRSGTWLLCGLLASTGVAGRPHEWFWRDAEEPFRRAWGVTSFEEYVARVRDAGTTPNGLFGAKVMWGYFGELLDRLRELDGTSDDVALLHRFFPAPHFIWVRREDVAAQAVSWAKAIQTDHWHHFDNREPRAAVYDREEIDALAREIATHEAAWQSWFTNNNVDPLVLRFEDLVANAVRVTRTVLEHLDIAAAGVPIEALTLKVSDAQNDEWLARYRGSA
jgi:LPS sulfotransferase NodH